MIIPALKIVPHILSPHKKTKQARSACLVYYNKILVELHTLAKEGITVTAFAPGIVKTPMMYDIAHRVGQV